MPCTKDHTRCDLYVFGANDEGQLGNGRKQEKEFEPTCAIRGADFRSMTVVGGSKHTLLLDECGNLFAAGKNNERQVGYFANHNDGPSALRDSLIAAEDNFLRFARKHSGISFCAAAWESSASIIDVGHSYGLTHAHVYTEGLGNHGELGRGPCKSTAGVEANIITGQIKLDPILTPFQHPVRDFAAGHSHYAVVLTNGEVWGWGKANKHQLGNALEGPLQMKEITTPTKLQHVPFHVWGVTCGKEFTYVVDSGIEGRHAILGTDKGGLKTNMPPHVKDWKQIEAMWYAIFVLFKDGTLKAWGKENLFQLIPPNLPPIDRIAVGSEHIIALTQRTVTTIPMLISWGWGEHGNCGDVSRLNPPPLMPRCCVTGRWNEIDIPGKILSIGAAQSTSFVLSEIAPPNLAPDPIGCARSPMSDPMEAIKDNIDEGERVKISGLKFYGLNAGDSAGT